VTQYLSNIARGDIADELEVACPNPKDGKNAAMQITNPARILGFSICLAALILSCGIAGFKDRPCRRLRSKRTVS